MFGRSVFETRQSDFSMLAFMSHRQVATSQNNRDWRNLAARAVATKAKLFTRVRQVRALEYALNYSHNRRVGRALRFAEGRGLRHVGLVGLGSVSCVLFESGAAGCN